MQRCTARAARRGPYNNTTHAHIHPHPCPASVRPRSLESGKPEQRRESSLKFQTRCVRCFADGAGYALSSVEGRVAMEFFDLGDEAQAKKYAFKCHRRNEGGRDVVYPVNAIAFNAAHGTFATGGERAEGWR